jgi:DNA-binding NarL/FixJ family response regulator
MPKRDGFSTLEEIKKRGIKVPVVISSNLSQEEDLEKAKRLGAIDFFIKSNTPINKIVESIRKYLEV